MMKRNPISNKAQDEFKKSPEANIPVNICNNNTVARCCKSGSADILSISYQTYINTPEFKITNIFQ